MKKTTDIPLITEPHPEGYSGPSFITLIGYNDENVLCIVDNVHNKQICAYVLDLCAPSGVSEQQVLSIAEDWFFNNRNKTHPLSVEFARLGLATTVTPVLRCFPIEFVTRVIGPLPKYPMSGTLRVRRKRRKSP